MEFKLIDDDLFEEFYGFEEDESMEVKDYKICETCNVSMCAHVNNQMICKSCGLIVDMITDNTEYDTALNTGYNTSNNCHLPIKYVGKDSYKYQVQIRNCTSSYSIIQANSIKKTLNKLNYNYEKLNIPKNILQKVADQYKLIRKSNIVYRGQILKGILASLTYYECLKAKITRKPKEIAEFFNIDNVNLSKGDHKLRKLIVSGVIDLDIDEIDMNNNFLYSYLLRINIDLEYLAFLEELFEFIDVNRIINPNSKVSTKTVGLIFLLIICKELKISQEDLYNEFRISISTFKKIYFSIIKRIDTVEHIFIKHNIPIVKTIPRTKKKNMNL